MLPLNKVELTAYRFSGLIGSTLTLSQSIIWLILSFSGVLCKYTGCGSNSPKNTFSYCFYLTYYYVPENTTDSFSRLNFVDPDKFHTIMWVSVFLSIANLIISAITLKEFVSWENARPIKLLAKLWPISILCVSCMELIFFIVFIYDIMSINWSEEDINCFLKTDLEIFYSSYTNEHNPAPYLIQLKSNLQTMKKKIKRMKKKLQFLNTIVDKENPDHVKNPFISKRLARNYVEEIWKDMFNHDIRDIFPNKSNILPSDEILKDFVTSEDIDLDELDEDLIRNFDGLTNIKYTKPIKSSNVVFGKPFDLSPSLTLEKPTVTDDLANLLLLYFKHSDQYSTNYTKFNRKFDDFFEDLFERLKSGRNAKQEDKSTKRKDYGIKRKNNENEEFLSRLMELIDCATMQEQNQTDSSSSKIKSSIIKDIFENYGDDEIDDEEVLSSLQKTVKNQYEMKKYKDRTQWTNEKPINSGVKFRQMVPDAKIFSEEPQIAKPKEVKQRTIPYENYLIKELCENCSNFVLGPSILCMIMSLKFFLIWFLNIALAIATLYYDNLIEIRRKSFNFY